MWGTDPEVQQFIEEEMEATKDFVMGHCVAYRNGVLCERATWDHKDNQSPVCVRCRQSQDSEVTTQTPS
jgi:hypothetical protein